MIPFSQVERRMAAVKVAEARLARDQKAAAAAAAKAEVAAAKVTKSEKALTSSKEAATRTLVQRELGQPRAAGGGGQRVGNCGGGRQRRGRRHPVHCSGRGEEKEKEAAVNKGAVDKGAPCLLCGHPYKAPGCHPTIIIPYEEVTR